MNVEELRRNLTEAGANPFAYQIQEKSPLDSAWCLKRQGKTWLVFWFERGTRWRLQRFRSEEKACEYFLAQVMPGETRQADSSEGRS